MTWFNTVTWNIYHKTDRDKVASIIGNLRDQKDVSVILGQEATAPWIKDVFRNNGFNIFHYRPEYIVAWDPDTWILNDQWGERLSPTGYWDIDRHSDCAIVELTHRRTRQEGRFLSYHTPAHVQLQNPMEKPLKALKESAISWRRLNKEFKGDFVCFGGDDNVDERRGIGHWPFLLKAATGLEQVQAPNPTFGKRRIDDFRIRGLNTGAGWTQDGGGDHKIHGRRFNFK